ncbi:MAG: PspA/IM30 family protein [Sphaerochaetaceae bacterium]|nr:PspA/IM30 family protein [Sphaerochaetaceae bacterium]
MKLFTRLRRIVGSKINYRLDKAEDPEKMIRYMIREIEEALVDAKTETTAKIATLTMIEKERKDAQDAVARWIERAELAVSKEKDELARQALNEKKNATRRLTHLDEEITQMNSIIAEMHSHVQTLQAKKDEIMDKQRMLIQRAYHAKEKKHLMETLKSLDSSATVRNFNEFEQTITRLEAQASLAEEETQHITAEQKFSKMEADAAIEQELEEMKQRINS